MKIFSTEGINVESTLLSKRGEQGVTKISILVHDGASASASAFATVIEGGDQFETETAFTSSNTNPTTTVSVGTSTFGPTKASITNPFFGTPASTTSTSVLSPVTNFTSNTISSTTSNLASISSTSIGGQSFSTDTRSTSSGATITVSISGATVTQTATSSASTSKSFLRNTAATAVLFTFLGLISVAISVIWFVKAARRRTTNHGGDCQESATVHSARSHSGHSRIITPFPSDASEVNASRIQETKVRLSDISSSIDGSLHSVPCYSESSPPAYMPTSEDPEVYQQV